MCDLNSANNSFVNERAILKRLEYKIINFRDAKDSMTTPRRLLLCWHLISLEAKIISIHNGAMSTSGVQQKPIGHIARFNFARLIDFGG